MHQLAEIGMVMGHVLVPMGNSQPESYQVPLLCKKSETYGHCWTRYCNAGGVAKDTDHVLIDGHWRMLQNRMVYRSTQLLNTYQRLVVATLKLQLKSRRMVPSQPRLDVSKLKD